DASCRSLPYNLSSQGSTGGRAAGSPTRPVSEERHDEHHRTDHVDGGADPARPSAAPSALRWTADQRRADQSGAARQGAGAPARNRAAAATWTDASGSEACHTARAQRRSRQVSANASARGPADRGEGHHAGSTRESARHPEEKP